MASQSTSPTVTFRQAPLPRAHRISIYMSDIGASLAWTALAGITRGAAALSRYTVSLRIHRTATDARTRVAPRTVLAGHGTHAIGAYLASHWFYRERDRPLACATRLPDGNHAPLGGALLRSPRRGARVLLAPHQDARGCAAGGAAGAVLRLRCPRRPSLLPNATHPVFPPRCQIRRMYRSPVDSPFTRGSPWPRRGWCCITVGVWILRARAGSARLRYLPSGTPLPAGGTRHRHGLCPYVRR